MRRVLLGLALGALIFGVAFAGAKVATVTNPMSSDLDGGGHQIFNVADINATANIGTSGYVLGQALVSFGGSVILEPSGVSVITILSGNADPSVEPGVFANLGSLYVGTAALWRKSGTADTDWTRLSP